MELEILTADKILYSGNVKRVTIPGTKGRFTVLEGHASIVSLIAAGKVVYYESDEKGQSIEVNAGTVRVNDNKIKICLY